MAFVSTQEKPCLLSIEGLETRYVMRRDWLGRPHTKAHAVNTVDIQIAEGETLGVIGESGCGKSTLARSIIGLAPVTNGKILFKGKDIATFDKAERLAFQKSVQIVFQDPQSSLNPRMRVWQIITEPLLIQQDIGPNERRLKAVELANQVGIAENQLDRFPHEFSGGQRQRIAIARALATQPELIILDEPTSALDVSVQAQVINLLLHLQETFGLAYLFISHDVSVINHICDRVAVMYLGSVMEQGTTDDILNNSSHPYSQQLVSMVSSIDQSGASGNTGLAEPPSNRTLPKGCYYQQQCTNVSAGCESAQNWRLLENTGSEHFVRCHRASTRTG